MRRRDDVQREVVSGARGQLEIGEEGAPALISIMWTYCSSGPSPQ